MLKTLRASIGTGLIFLTLSGCSDITGPQLLTNFDWGEVDEPEAIVEGVSASVILGDLFIVGQFTTPTRCYNLDAQFQRSGTNLTVRVKADSNNAPNCDNRLGGFRYTAVMSNLKFNTYQLRVIHEISGGNGGEFTKTVTVH